MPSKISAESIISRHGRRVYLDPVTSGEWNVVIFQIQGRGPLSLFQRKISFWPPDIPERRYTSSLIVISGHWSLKGLLSESGLSILRPLSMIFSIITDMKRGFRQLNILLSLRWMGGGYSLFVCAPADCLSRHLLKKGRLS